MKVDEIKACANTTAVPPPKLVQMARLGVVLDDFVVFDRVTARPLQRALVWQDRRGDAICAERIAAGREALIHGRTGLKIDSYFSASKLQWLVRQHPEIRAKLADGSALIGTIDVSDLSADWRKGFRHRRDQRQPHSALRSHTPRVGRGAVRALWEMPRAALPEVRDCSACFGETTLEGALPSSVPICGVMGDSQASLVAQRCFAPGAAKATSAPARRCCSTSARGRGSRRRVC